MKTPASEAKLPELNNQYELNGEALTIGSVLKWTNAATGATTYYFYNEADVTEPQDGLNGLTVTLAAEATETTFDLSTIDPAQVSVKYGAFQNTENTTGSLTIEARNNVLTLAIDAERVTTTCAPPTRAPLRSDSKARTTSR